MRKVVSIALFGDVAKYGVFLRTFVQAHLNLFPTSEGWELVLHTDESPFNPGTVHKNCIDHIRVWARAPLTRAMLWRLDPVFSMFPLEAPDYVFSRDIDALPTPRDRLCCDQFIASGADVHTIHDAPVHTGIMGGLCGFKAKAFREKTGFQSLGDVYQFAGNVDWARHGTDQDVLNRIVDKFTDLTLLEHRYNGWWNGPGVHQAKAPSVYRCRAYSTPTPGVHRDSDLLAAHMGAAGYDIEKARAFWDACGDPKVNEALARCEK